MFLLAENNGPTFEFVDGTIIGLELTKPTINGTDGTVNGHRYFSCKPGHEYFVPVQQLIDVDCYNEDEKKEEETELKPIGHRRKRGWITLNKFVQLATKINGASQSIASLLILTHSLFCESKFSHSTIS